MSTGSPTTRKERCSSPRPGCPRSPDVSMEGKPSLHVIGAEYKRGSPEPPAQGSRRRSPPGIWRYRVLAVGTRLLRLVVVLFLVSLFTFMLLHLARGDPAAVIVGPNGTAAQIHRIDHQLGLDRPVIDQYGTWAINALHGNLGQSLVPPDGPVANQIRQALPVSLE